MVKVLVFACLVSVTLVAIQSSGFGQTANPWTTISTIAGNGRADGELKDGAATEVSISNPFGVEPYGDGDLLIASYDRHVLFQLSRSKSELTRIAGTGKPGFAASSGAASETPMNFPHEVRVDSNGQIFVADTSNHSVGKIIAAKGQWTRVAGTGTAGFGGDGGPAISALINEAYSIAVDGNQLFVADLQNHRIRLVDLQTNIITTIAGNGRKGKPVNGQLAVEQSLEGPRSLAVDKDNLWIVQREGNSVWRIDRASGKIFHVAGTGRKGFSGDGGPAVTAELNGPKGIAVDPGRFVYIADTENNAIRRVNLASGVIDTVVGSLKGEQGFNGDGPNLTDRLLARPHGVCLLGDNLIIGDSENHRVRMLSK
jgi:sugar lactone lactonase YvrE